MSYEASLRENYIAVRQRLLSMPPARRPVHLSKGRQIEHWPEEAPVAPYDEFIEDRPAFPTAKSIIASVAAKHNMSSAVIIGPLRAKPICAARHEAAFRLIVELGLSYPAAGRRLGNRDHTTILHSVKTHVARFPEAAEIWARFCSSVLLTEASQRADAIRMHFGEGRTVAYAARKLGLSRFRVMSWIIDESERRNGRKAA